MRNPHIVLIALLASTLASSTVFARGNWAQGHRGHAGDVSEPVVIRIQSASPGRVIDPAFLGTNNLYWIDDDAAWAKPQFVRQLKELGVRSLRYPGGEVADNYDWETNRLEQPERFPIEARTEAERNMRLDYLEFLANARKAGIEDLFFVVNLEGAFLRQGDRETNINLYADKAARWVKAVRKAGYRVKHWEVGNESYLGSAYPLTAHEYASALKIFSRKMRAADPEILIGAIGPHAYMGGDAIGFADKLAPSRLAACRAAKQQGIRRAMDENNRLLCGKGDPAERRDGAAVWWNVILNEAADSFDFAVIHRYRMVHLQKGQLDAGFDSLAQYVAGLKRYIEQGKGGRIELALTEWNTPDQMSDALGESWHALEIVELLGNYLEGGVDFAMYWPMRMPGHAFPLFSGDMIEPTASFDALRFARRNIGAQLLPASYNPRSGLYTLASKSGDGYSVLLVNRARAGRCVRFELDGAAVAGLSGEMLAGDGSAVRSWRLTPVTMDVSDQNLCLPGQAMAAVRFR